MRKETEERLKRVHKGMMSRCYNKNDGGYYNPGNKIYRVTNRNKFSAKHNLSRNSILRVLRKEQGKHKGWMFYWEEELLRGVEKFND